MKRNAWTIDDERHCLRLVRQGKPYSEIATEIGRSKEAVAKFISKKRKEEPGMWRRRVASGKASLQPCWDCFYASGATKDGWKCPWAGHLKPVPGWDAELVHLKCYQSNVKTETLTYSIKSCPRFERG